MHRRGWLQAYLESARARKCQRIGEGCHSLNLLHPSTGRKSSPILYFGGLQPPIEEYDDSNQLLIQKNIEQGNPDVHYDTSAADLPWSRRSRFLSSRAAVCSRESEHWAPAAAIRSALGGQHAESWCIGEEECIWAFLHRNHYSRLCGVQTTAWWCEYHGVRRNGSQSLSSGWDSVPRR